MIEFTMGLVQPFSAVFVPNKRNSKAKLSKKQSHGTHSPMIPSAGWLSYNIVLGRKSAVKLNLENS